MSVIIRCIQRNVDEDYEDEYQEGWVTSLWCIIQLYVMTWESGKAVHCLEKRYLV